MTPRIFTTGALIVAACAGGASGGGCSKDGDDSEPTECNVLIGDSFPEEGAGDVCFRSDIEFEIEGGDEDAVITLADAGGADVPGTTTANPYGTLVAFHPDAPLASNASYTATLTYCDGTETRSFTTDAYGEPLKDAPALVGGIYMVDLRNESRFHKPPGVANVLQPMLTRKIWLEVLEPTSATGITLRLAVAAEGKDTVQDMCIPTVDFENGSLDGPTFEVGPEDIQIPIGTQLVELQGVIATGTFSSDGATFGCGGFTGLIDTRPLVPLMGGKEEAYVCQLIGAYGAQCVACDDGELLCMDLEVDQAVAHSTEGITIAVVTPQDVEDNPKCP